MSKPVAALLTLLVIPFAASAQVGHDPIASPYRDIRSRTNFVLLGGLVGGSSGRLGIGPSSGQLGGARFEIRMTGPSDAFLGLSYGSFERLIVNPDEGEATRVSGPVNQSVVFVDAGLSVVLTGDKTWHRFAPYLGGGMGLAFGQGAAADSSGYRFHAKLVSGPHAGIRFYASQSISLRVEGRLLFWRIKYPTGFFLEPIRAPGEAPVLDPAFDVDTEWTSHPMLTFAVGYSFRL